MGGGAVNFCAALVGLGWLLIGCQPAIGWRFGVYDDVAAEAKTQRKPLFVYFRNWYSVECTNFEEHVLSARAVRDAVNSMVCVPLEYDVAADRRLAESWGIKAVPAFAIVAADGQVLETGSGALTAEALLAALQRAQAKVASASTLPALP